MPLVKKIYPHLLTIQWGEGGMLATANLINQQVFEEDGIEVATTFLPPRPLSLTDFDGDNLKLAEVAEAVKSSGAHTLAALQIELSEMRKELRFVSEANALLTEQLAHANTANANLARELTDSQDQNRMLGESNRRMAVDTEVARNEMAVAQARYDATNAALTLANEAHALAVEELAATKQLLPK